MSWKRWLPDYDVPKTVEKLVNAGVLKDRTWQEDSVPHFEAIFSDGSELVFWVDHPNSSKRALPDGPRYVLERHLKGSLPQTIFESNNLQETLVAFKGFLEDLGSLRAL